MTNHVKIALAAALIAAFASPALAEDDWIANSGRFSPDVVMATARAPSHAGRTRHLIEGRNAAFILSANAQPGYEGLVQAFGN
jgi:hypothetical protein